MTKDSTSCDLCGEGNLEEKQSSNKVTYRSTTSNLRMDFYECDTCGVEFTSPKQTRNNKRRMTAFKKEVNETIAN